MGWCANGNHLRGLPCPSCACPECRKDPCVCPGEDAPIKLNTEDLDAEMAKLVHVLSRQLQQARGEITRLRETPCGECGRLPYYTHTEER